MKRQRDREEPLEDAALRQKNIVFPDTVRNETRIWKSLVSGERKLSWVQKIGFSLFALLLAVSVYTVIATALETHSTFSGLADVFITFFRFWPSLFLIVVIAVAALRRRLFRSRNDKRRDR